MAGVHYGGAVMEEGLIVSWESFREKANDSLVVCQEVWSERVYTVAVYSLIVYRFIHVPELYMPSS